MRDKNFIAEHRGGLLTMEGHLKLMKWACDCSENVLYLFESEDNNLLKDVIIIAKKWIKGKASVGEAREASIEAHRLARKLSNPISIAVARSVGHAVATAHMADHSLEAAVYALKAVKLAGKSVKDERVWQNKQVPIEFIDIILSIRTKKETALKI